MTRRARHEQKDDAFGFRGKLRGLGGEGIDDGRRGQAVLTEQRAEGDRAEADAALLEEPAPRDFLRALAVIQMVLTAHREMTNDECRMTNEKRRLIFIPS